ncbi:pilus assembly protein TadB [Paenibacillus spiritus]|uniref:Pilus assembly protein TadB n=1 Tax=Paenibacillus spiritus TaxID=2496557 RepID=A0A5J5G9X6_9BACL|nr:type II secretion system F family protein [Paenibacillus spiritus]KAA9004917.1 pilus assembly protein TadB [Paenibacillus spiritus]
MRQIQISARSGAGRASDRSGSRRRWRKGTDEERRSRDNGTDAKNDGVERPERGSRPGSALPDYKQYTLGRKTTRLAAAVGCTILYGVGLLFYSNPLLALLLVPGGFYAPRLLRNYMRSRRRRILNLQFKQTLFSLSSSLSAGRSVENAFREAIRDLLLLDPDGGGDMAAELNIICTRLEYGQPIEEALQDFSRRAGMEDVARFADVFSVCKRTGGDLIEVVRRTSGIIGEKLDIEQEIAVSVAQKRFEAQALLLSPLAMLLFMNLSAGDYMQPMHTGVGLVISTLALGGLVLCYGWISKIMNIPL